MIETIYLDTCVLNRPSDDQSQPRVRQEAEALSRILDLVYIGRVHWSTSSLVRLEIDRNPDALRRVRALNLLASATATTHTSPESITEATRLAALGLPQTDALHIAIAHETKVDWLITTDDRLIRSANRLLPGYSPQLINPIDWLQRRQPWLLQP